MKKRILTIFLAIVMIATIATGTLINADTTTTYKYTGIAESGYSYSNVGTAKFNMTEGYIAYCVDINVTIKQDIPYIKLALEDSRVEAHFSGTEKTEKIRAILNYAWGKTGKTEISAIQLALWSVMHGEGVGIDLPTTGPVKDKYDEIMSLNGIPAGDEIVNNEFTLENLIGTSNENQFIFDVSTSGNTNINFKVYNGETLLEENVDYTIEFTEGEKAIFTWRGSRESNICLTIEGTTTQHKAVNAWVFASIDENGDINFNRSQTVVGVHPLDSFQSKTLELCLDDIPVTTTTTATATETSTTVTTTVKETTTTTTTPTTEESVTTTTTIVEETTTEPTTTTIEETTTELTTTESTTTEETEETKPTVLPIKPETTTPPTKELPATGENHNNYGIYFLGMSLILLAAAGIGVFKKRKLKE